MSQKSTAREITPGRGVYDKEGNRLGTIRGFDENGFYVTAAEDLAVLDTEELSADHGDAIMWRCWECGEMGQIEDIPAECPTCGAPKEEIYYWMED